MTMVFSWSASFIIVLVQLNCKIIGQSSSPFTHQTFLDTQNNFQISWSCNESHIDLEVCAKTRGWLAIGISPTGGMDKSDVMLGWVDDATGAATIQDRWNDVDQNFNVMLALDTKQDWTLVQGTQNATHTIVRATRLLTTCDTQDRPISRETIRLIYSSNPSDPPTPTSIAKHTMRGTKSILFYSPTFAINKPMSLTGEQNLQQMEIRVDKVMIPTEMETVYHCRLIKLPVIDRKYHVTSVIPVITPGNEGVVHHVLVYLCTDKVTDATEPKDFNCNHDRDNTHRDRMLTECIMVMAAWAIGGSALLYPKEAGLPFDQKLSNRYLFVEMHYDNSNPLPQPRVDSSGLTFILTDQLRQFDAGILATGSLDVGNGYPMMIPPDTENFIISGACESNCTQSFFPPTGITVFQAFLHGHLQCRKVRMRHIRGGSELEPVAKDDFYDFNYQESRTVDPPRKVLPGDRLLVECNYDTKGKKTATFGGHGTKEEMCLVYITYYPVVNLAMCGTMVDKPKFFQLTKYNPPPEKSPRTENMFVEAANAVKNFLTKSYAWNSDSIAKLQNFYATSAYSAACIAASEKESKFIPPAAPQDFVAYQTPGVCKN